MSLSDLSQEELLIKLNRIDGINAIKGLDGMSGQMPLYIKLVKNFANEQLGRADELRQLHQAKDWEVLRRRCHSLKSYTAYLGAFDLSELCAIAENALGKGATDLATIEAICIVIDPMVAEVRDLVIEDEVPQKVEFNQLKFRKDLITLLPLLQQSDFAAEEALKSLMLLTENTEYHRNIHQIFEFVDDVEYELAVEHTKKLLEQLI